MKLKSPPLITGVLLDFEDSKCITFRINVIPLPASTGHRELWQCNGSTKPEYRSLGRVVTFGLQTSAFVPHGTAGFCAGLRNNPPSEPFAAIRQYSIGRPVIAENYHPKTSE